MSSLSTTVVGVFVRIRDVWKYEYFSDSINDKNNRLSSIVSRTRDTVGLLNMIIL
jgi:hypothetical protein